MSQWTLKCSNNITLRKLNYKEAFVEFSELRISGAAIFFLF